MKTLINFWWAIAFLLICALPMAGFSINPEHITPESREIIAVENSNWVDVEVKWTTFNAIQVKGQSLLKWSTCKEINNKGFLIQRSKDLVNWKSIAFVKGRTKSLDYVDYQFVDRNPANGPNFYRLKPHYESQKTSFSEVVKVNCQKSVDPVESTILVASNL